VLVEHYSARGMVERVEKCLLHMDVRHLDFDAVLKLCRKKGLYTALAYVYNGGLQDYLTPVDAMLEAMVVAAAGGAGAAAGAAGAGALAAADEQRRARSTGWSDEHSHGYRLLLYLSYCFAGRGFPRGEVPKSQLPAVRGSLLALLTERRPDPAQLAGGAAGGLATRFSREGEFPRLRLLLGFDTAELLALLGLLFDSPDANFRAEGAAASGFAARAGSGSVDYGGGGRERSGSSFGSPRERSVSGGIIECSPDDAMSRRATLRSLCCVLLGPSPAGAQAVRTRAQEHDLGAFFMLAAKYLASGVVCATAADAALVRQVLHLPTYLPTRSTTINCINLPTRRQVLHFLVFGTSTEAERRRQGAGAAAAAAAAAAAGEGGAQGQGGQGHIPAAERQARLVQLLEKLPVGDGTDAPPSSASSSAPSLRTAASGEYADVHEDTGGEFAFDKEELLRWVRAEGLHRAEVALCKRSGNTEGVVSGHLADPAAPFRRQIFVYLRKRAQQISGLRQRAEDERGDDERDAGAAAGAGQQQPSEAPPRQQWERELVELKAAVLPRIAGLMAVGGSETALLVVEFMPDEHGRVMAALKGSHPRLYFDYLCQLVEAREDGTGDEDGGMGGGMGGDGGGGGGAHNPMVELLRQSQPALDKAARESSALGAGQTLADEFIRLLCEFEPARVLAHLQRHDDIKLDDCLELCERFQIMDATAYLLERTGNVMGALKLIIDRVDARLLDLEQSPSLANIKPELHLNRVGGSHLSPGMGQHGRKRAMPEPHEPADLLRAKKLGAGGGGGRSHGHAGEREGGKVDLRACPEGGLALALLEVAVALCDRSSNTRHRDAEESRGLWFALLDKLVNSQTRLKGTHKLRGQSKAPGAAAAGAAAGADAGSVGALMQNALNELVRVVLEGMAGHVPLRAIMCVTPASRLRHACVTPVSRQWASPLGVLFAAAPYKITDDH
jgi:hypothetical protein